MKKGNRRTLRNIPSPVVTDGRAAPDKAPPYLPAVATALWCNRAATSGAPGVPYRASPLVEAEWRLREVGREVGHAVGRLADGREKITLEYPSAEIRGDLIL